MFKQANLSDMITIQTNMLSVLISILVGIFVIVLFSAIIISFIRNIYINTNKNNFSEETNVRNLICSSCETISERNDTYCFTCGKKLKMIKYGEKL